MPRPRSRPLVRHLISLLLFAVVAAPPGSAQEPEEPCKPDCPTQPWGPPQEEHISMPDGCTVKVSFNYRWSCFTAHQVVITGIESWWGNPSPQCDYLKSAPLQPILDAVTRELLRQNPAGDLPPTEPGCKTVWRVVDGSCWTRTVEYLNWEQLTFPFAKMKPCELTACCQKPYRVCLASGARSVTPLPYNAGYLGSCPDPGPGKPECEPVCEDDP